MMDRWNGEKRIKWSCVKVILWISTKFRNVVDGFLIKKYSLILFAKPVCYACSGLDRVFVLKKEYEKTYTKTTAAREQTKRETHIQM